jgi:hypothetical protein
LARYAERGRDFAAEFPNKIALTFAIGGDTAHETEMRLFSNLRAPLGTIIDAVSARG